MIASVDPIKTNPTANQYAAIEGDGTVVSSCLTPQEASLFLREGFKVVAMGVSTREQESIEILAEVMDALCSVNDMAWFEKNRELIAKVEAFIALPDQGQPLCL